MSSLRDRDQDGQGFWTGRSDQERGGDEGSGTLQVIALENKSIKDVIIESEGASLPRNGLEGELRFKVLVIQGHNIGLIGYDLDM